MNAVVLAAHGLHCRWLGPYGNEWVNTPAADALACESVVFDRHFADRPSPTGFGSALPPTIFQTLAGAGITLALVDDRKGRDDDGLSWDLTVATNPTAHATPGDALLASVRSALVQLSGRSPWLLWVETDRLIPPWDFEFETYQQYAEATGMFDEEADEEPAEPTDLPPVGPVDPADTRLWHQLHNSFAAAVTSFDAELDGLIELFRDRGLDPSAAWVLTAGYGWPLGEHCVVGPAGSRMHPELVHLPLFVRLPGGRQGMRRVSSLTQTADLGPTLLDLFGLASPPDMTGTSLLPLAAGAAAVRRELIRTADGPERALRTAEWAYLPPEPKSGTPARLYHKPDDLWEVNDLAPRYPDECDRLAALLDGGPEPPPEPTP